MGDWDRWGVRRDLGVFWVRVLGARGAKPWGTGWRTWRKGCGWGGWRTGWFGLGSGAVVLVVVYGWV